MTTFLLILTLIALAWTAGAAMTTWPILGACYLICAAIVTVTLLASCVKAAEADARLREDDER